MPTALIVEDEPQANELLALLVQMRGYQTESAFTGTEALEHVSRRRPDLVFLDLMLPDTNGYDVCRALKGRRRTNLIPIVMVTARIAAENRLQSYRMGANQFVPKPYTPDQIFDAMAAADSWRQLVETHADHGEIAVDSVAEVEPFEQVATLQSLLLARTPCDEDSARQLALDLGAMAQNLIDWASRRRVGPHLATIRYEVLPERLQFVVRDLAGWSHADDLPHELALGLLIGRGRFDAVSHDDSGSETTLIRRFPPTRALPLD